MADYFFFSPKIRDSALVKKAPPLFISRHLFLCAVGIASWQLVVFCTCPFNKPVGVREKVFVGSVCGVSGPKSQGIRNWGPKEKALVPRRIDRRAHATKATVKGTQETRSSGQSNLAKRIGYTHLATSTFSGF